ncbi:MAG: hypothetical protein WCO52_05755 [bacterium]
MGSLLSLISIYNNNDNKGWGDVERLVETPPVAFFFLLYYGENLRTTYGKNREKSEFAHR